MMKHIPHKSPKPPKQKPWMTRELITIVHRRNRAYKFWEKNKAEEARLKFLSLRNKCQNMIRLAHQQYTENIFNLTDPVDDKLKATKRFWNYVKSKKKDSSSTAPLKENGVLISDAIGKANILNRQYCSVFSKEDTEEAPIMNPLNIPILAPITIDKAGVEKLLKNLKPGKAAGPDKISPRVLKELAPSISKPLAQLFQNSLNTGEVPHEWNTALVTPIFKKGDKHNAANYRPVSLTSICCKLCEHIIAKNITTHLESQNLLTESQHGFRAKRSCETQLLLFADELTKSLSQGKQVDVAVLDFSKAFDIVPHKRLLSKLHHYGIRNSTLTWIGSFLGNRSQQVVVDGETSSSAPVTSGVPQGSVLGPILFLIYINDMPESITSNCRLFADDSIVYREIESPQDTTCLQEDLASLERWEDKWGMSFNPSKCNIIRISRKRKNLDKDYYLKNEKLEVVKTATYLGVNIADNLTWHSQITKAAAKGNRALGFVRRNIKTRSKKTKVRAYETLVRPILEYCSTVWDPHQNTLIYDIERVQRRAARYATHTYDPRASVTALLDDLKWQTLQDRRKKSKITMMHKIVNSNIAIPNDQLIISSTKTRGNIKKFIQIPTKTNYHKSSFFPSTIPLWNSLPTEIAAIDDLEEFKRKLSSLQLKPPRS